jgi:hypothetical protein
MSFGRDGNRALPDNCLTLEADESTLREVQKRRSLIDARAAVITRRLFRGASSTVPRRQPLMILFVREIAAAALSSADITDHGTACATS